MKSRFQWKESWPNFVGHYWEECVSDEEQWKNKLKSVYRGARNLAVQIQLLKNVSYMQKESVVALGKSYVQSCLLETIEGGVRQRTVLFKIQVIH